MDRLDGLLSDIIVDTESPRETVRAGFMALLLYPAATCSNGSSLRPSIIARIVSGLSIAQECVEEGEGQGGWP